MKFENNIYAFLNELNDFSYGLSYTDHIWNLIFQEINDTWNHLYINKYNQTYYIHHINGNLGRLEVEPKKSIKVMESFGHSFYNSDNEHLSRTWDPLITSARKWLKIVNKDWIKANKEVLEQHPLNQRYGIVPHSLIRTSLPDVYQLDKDLGKVRTGKLLRLLEDGFFLKSENTEVASMTAATYFDYCKIAYIAGKRKGEIVDESLSGREMYIRYADGRHEGLLDIDEKSEQAFADWIDGTHPKRVMGGHPWEIKRGGNTTHIDLYVTRPNFKKEGFTIKLRGESISRMAETLKMLFAIHKASLPISIANSEGVRKRLLALDNIGIVPAYASLHRANQHFRKEDDVYDVMHYDELGRFKRRITPFITWEPLPLLKPSNV